MGEATFANGDLLRASPQRIILPVLIPHGTRDHATTYRGSQFLLDHAGSSDKTPKLCVGHHDLLNYRGKGKEAFADIRGWIDAHLQ